MKTIPEISVLTFATPFDRLLEVAVNVDCDKIYASRWATGEALEHPATAKTRRSPLATTIEQQMQRYFKRRLAQFDLPLEFFGTEFTCAVWRAAAEIPFGKTASYAEIARAVMKPGAHRGVARAIGLANHALFIPAHRIIGADGTIKGAGKQSMRARLFAFETALPP